MKNKRALLELRQEDLRELTEEETRTLIGLNLKLMNSEFIDMRVLDRELVGDTGYEMMNNHLISFNVPRGKIQPELLIYVLSLCHRPIEITLWAITLGEIVAEHGEATLNLWCTRCFPHGVPTRDAYSRIWNESKQHEPASDH